MGKIRSNAGASIAEGYVEGGRNPLSRKISIVFDDETFAQVKALAVEQHCSFAAMARELVEVGLENDRILKAEKR